MSGPLAGVKVVEVTVAAVGPQSGKLLGELGADVIHIEQPGREARDNVPPPRLHGWSVRYIASNQSKRSVALDLKDPEHLAIAHRLVAASDVFLENMRPGTAERLGLGYAKLSELNPRLVYCSASGYGQEGPLVYAEGADPQLQAISGFAGLTGAADGPPELFRHFAHLDFNTSMYVVQAILLGLLHRGRTGQGQKVEVAMLGAALALQSSRLAELFATGQSPPRLGSACTTVVPERAFRCQDGRYACVAATSEAEWRRLCQAIDRPELAEDARFATNAARVTHRASLEAELEAVFAGRPVRWWEIQCTRHRVPFGRVLSFHELRHHPQAVLNGYLVEEETRNWGRLIMDGLPWRFSRTPGTLTPSPIPGEHTAEVIAGLEGRDSA